MGISGGKKTTTKSTETVGPSAYAKPWIDRAASTFQPAYEQSRSVMQRYLPQIDRSAGYYGDVLDGKFMDGNPYLDKVLEASNRGIADSVNSQFMDRFGSGYHTKTLADSIAENENRVRYGDYATERGYMNEAAGRLPQVATIATALPMVPAQGYADMTSGLMGRYLTSNGTQEQKQSGGLLGSILQTAATLGPAIFSDVRLKTDIEHIGATNAGLPLYRWRYDGDDTLHIGPMAQDVEVMQPDALGPDIHGFKTVYYGGIR